MTIIIADSGSTKTDWIILSPLAAPCRFTTLGLNPCLMDDEAIANILKPAFEGHQADVDGDVTLHFYGAGCRPDQCARMAALIAAAFHLPDVSQVHVASDLLGAAHALCGDTPGIVAILGTGSGSALYDGHTFQQQTPSLGFILGDEGSGAVLGRRLVSDLYKGALPHHLLAAFEAELSVNITDIIQHVYALPAPNRYLAHFAPFLSAHVDEPAIHALLLDEFRRFFLRNIRPYARPELPVHFVGSIAAVFEPLLREAAATACPDIRFTVGRILPSPIQSLADYWTKVSNNEPTAQD